MSSAPKHERPIRRAPRRARRALLAIASSFRRQRDRPDGTASRLLRARVPNPPHPMIEERALRDIVASSGYSKSRAYCEEQRRTVGRTFVDDIDGRSEGARDRPAPGRMSIGGSSSRRRLTRIAVQALDESIGADWPFPSMPRQPARPSPIGRKHAGDAPTRRPARAQEPASDSAPRAKENGVAVPACGRIPQDVERQYNEANRRS